MTAERARLPRHRREGYVMIPEASIRELKERLRRMDEAWERGTPAQTLAATRIVAEDARRIVHLAEVLP